MSTKKNKLNNNKSEPIIYEPNEDIIRYETWEEEEEEEQLNAGTARHVRCLTNIRDL